MDYKTAIEEILLVVKSETKMTQEEISEDLGKERRYLASTISRGGNKAAYNLLKAKYAHILAKKIPDDNVNLQAQLQALREDFLMLKAELKSRPIEDIQVELERRTTLILNNLRRSKTN